jgi:hypothetical protein
MGVVILLKAVDTINLFLYAFLSYAQTELHYNNLHTKADELRLSQIFVYDLYGENHSGMRIIHLLVVVLTLFYHKLVRMNIIKY